MRRISTALALLLCTAAAVAGGGPAGASGPGTPVWRYDYGITAQGVPTLGKVVTIGAGSYGRIQFGFPNGLATNRTDLGEISTSYTGPVASSVLAVTADATHEYVARPNSNVIDVVDQSGTRQSLMVTQWAAPTIDALAVSPNDPYYNQQVVWAADSFDLSIEGIGSTGSFPPFSSRTSAITSMAVAPDGTILVLDGPHGYVQRLTSQGIAIGRFGSPGAGDGQFSNAKGIAVDSAGTVFVADTGNSRIDMFSSTGTYLGQFGSHVDYNFGVQFGAGDFDAPSGVAVDCTGRLHVLDIATGGDLGATPTGRVAVYTGVAAPTGSCAGPSATTFAAVSHAGAVAGDKAGNTYVATNSAIRKYDPNGTLITSWSSPASGSAHWALVGGIAVAPNGDVYLADGQLQEVLQFHAAGSFVREWALPTQFQSSSIAVRASDGHVFVVSYFDQVREYTSAGTLVQSLPMHDIAGEPGKPTAVTIVGSSPVVAAISTITSQTAIERFDSSGAYVDQVAGPGREQGPDALGGLAPYPGGGYVIAAVAGSGNTFDTNTDGLLRIDTSGHLLSRLAEPNFPYGQQLVSPSADCAGRPLAANFDTGKVVRLSTSSTVCRWLPTATTGTLATRTTTTLSVRTTANPSSQVTKLRVEFGTSTSYGHATSWITLPSDNVSIAHTIQITGLLHAHTYHYRVEVTNASGTVFGIDRSATTS